ncbi:MAG: SAM-dependent chlorinase/fluorinase [Phormidesmis sp.]
MITLLSDFGAQDSYVAVMKGVIAAIAPRIPTCDLTHQVPPQDILAARFNLMMAYAYFPLGTVHLAVVDPGVGSARRAIALQTPSGFFVGPDNGLFSGVLDREPVLMAVSLTRSRYWRTAEPSATFHGRDIFAPVAAHLASGVPIAQVGDRILPETLVKPDLAPAVERQLQRGESTIRQFVGSLQYIDGFGNLISNIPASAVPSEPWQLTIETSKETPNGSRQVPGVKTYSDVPVGALAALVGNDGYVEVACNRSSAVWALRTATGHSAAIGDTVFLDIADDTKLHTQF